jgi:DNA processing protein
MTTRQLLIALNAADRIPRAALCTLSALHDRWQDLSPEQDLGARAATLGVTPKQLRRALELGPRAAELACRELERAERVGCRLITRLDEDYPRSLLDLSLPPPVLYCRGRLPSGPAVAIVGSRKMDAYGERAARLFGRQLAAAGVTVVSGFARGVDATAHRAALDGGGRTVAVLGCGVDVDYPRGNASLAADICENGAVLSEFALGAEPRAWRFPVRNRVIAALAVGTLVVQATFKSGSLITAHHALELGRDVYAVPGRIFDDGAQGTNALIADGALPAHEPRDILESLSIGVQQELFPAAAGRPPSEPATPRETLPARQPPPGLPGRIVEALLAERGRTAEEVSARTEVAVEEVVGALLELELGGWVRRAPGPVYLRV